MNPKLQDALDRAFPIYQMGGISGAMYPADEGEGQGWAISNEDWEVVAGVIRELVEDPVAAVRRGVESGTIKGEVRRYCEKHEALVGAIPHLCNVANWVIDGGGSPTDCRINDALVVSDGGGSCDGSGTCEATDHIEGCYRSTYVRPVSDGGSET